MVYAQVIVGSRTSVQELTYNVPASIIPYITPGSMVMVPLRQKKVKAVVVKLTRTLPKNIAGRIRDIISIEKSSTGFSQKQIKTIEDLANNYGTSFAEVAYHALSWPGKIINIKSDSVVKPTFIQALWPERKKLYIDLINKYWPKHSLLIIFSAEEYLLDFLNNINNNEIINIGVTKDEKILGQKLNTGENFLAVGLQRGAFIPLKKDDFLVVDSPYSIGLKQQSRPLMTVKEIGLTRAKNENIRVVLGGNILLINDYSFVKNKSWRLVKKRLEEYPIVVNDRKNTHDILLPTVLDEVNKYNSLLFLVGSKSWAPALICAKCRGIVRCSSCGQTLSVVSSSELKCSHCGLKTSYPKSCVSCHWPEFHPIGVGSAGLAHKLKAAYQTDISLISSGNSNIPDKNVVVATEKIINFPRRYFQATVVVDVDWQLAEANINSSWHMLNTLLQLRAVSQSMYVQTYLPDHWIWKAIRTGIDIDIYEQQLEDRKRYNLPPYGETLAFMRTGKSVVELESQYKNICEELGKYMPEIEMGELAIGKNKGSYYAKAYAQCSNRFTYAKKHTLRKLLPLAWSVDYDA